MVIKKQMLIAVLLFSISGVSYAIDPDAQNLIEKRRNVIKEYDVSSAEVLSIDNQYGSVKVNLWSKKEIKVEILITSNAPSPTRAAEYLNAVEIRDGRGSHLISLKTIIDKTLFGTSLWNSFKQGEKNFIQVDYTVYMPKGNSLIVKNEFGDVNIPTFYAPLTVLNKYGNFFATSLESSDNNINVQYGKAEIGNIVNSKMDFQYSDVKLRKAVKLMLNNKFGELMIGEVTDLNADIDYSGAQIGTIQGNGKIRVNYSGNFKIDELTRAARNLDIEAIYSSLVLPAEANKFNVTMSNGKFTYPTANVSFDIQPAKGQKSVVVRQYKGTVGSGSGSQITVVSKYGDVKLKD